MSDWLALDSSNIDSLCGEDEDYELAKAMEGLSWWQHTLVEIHFAIFDFGQPILCEKVKGKSNTGTWDPTDVDIFVSDDKEAWGPAVVSGISTWQNTAEYVEVEINAKVGQYVKVVINETQDAGPGRLAFGFPSTTTIFDVYGAVPTGRGRSRSGFKPVKDADRLRGIRRNALY